MRFVVLQCRLNLSLAALLPTGAMNCWKQQGTRGTDLDRFIACGACHHFPLPSPVLMPPKSPMSTTGANAATGGSPDTEETACVIFLRWEDSKTESWAKKTRNATRRGLVTAWHRGWSAQELSSGGEADDT